MTYKDKVKEIVSSEAFKNLETYVQLIEDKNKVMNLTGFTGDRLWEEGIFESITLLMQSFGEVKGKRMLDIGAGAGFPSIPFLIAFPENELTIYEPLKKRTLFLDEVKEALNLNVNILNVRAEDAKEEEYFDLVTARAVAHLGILCEISSRPAKVGAIFAFLKGPKAEEEIVQSKWIINKLSIEPKLIEIQNTSRSNYVVKYKKTVETPSKFPREWRVIKSSY